MLWIKCSYKNILKWHITIKHLNMSVQHPAGYLDALDQMSAAAIRFWHWKE